MSLLLATATAPAPAAEVADAAAAAVAELTNGEFGLRLLVALLLGGAIGLERQWRQRASGLRTNALVSVGSALFVLLSVGFPGVETSPTRIAAQVVSGIGFLGAGVIMRDGVNIRGINTAATIWCAAAVGATVAAGMLEVAAMGAVAVVVVNIALRPLGYAIDRQPDRGSSEVETEYRVRVICGDGDEGRVRMLVVQALSEDGFALRKVESEDIAADGDGPARAKVRAAAVTEGRDDGLIEAAVNRLSLEPGISAVRWDVVEHELDDVR